MTYLMYKEKKIITCAFQVKDVLAYLITVYCTTRNVPKVGALQFSKLSSLHTFIISTRKAYPCSLGFILRSNILNSFLFLFALRDTVPLATCIFALAVARNGFPKITCVPPSSSIPTISKSAENSSFQPSPTHMYRTIH